MGYYIQGPTFGKANHIVKTLGGELLSQAPKKFSDIPANKALVVVVDNGAFEAAGLCYNESEFNAFVLYPDSGRQRPRQFVLMDRKTAFQAAGLRQH